MNHEERTAALAAPVATKPPEKPKAVVAEVVDISKRLAGLARSIKGYQRKAVDSVLAIGEQLAEARDLLSDHAGGSYGKWLRDKVGMSRMSAHRFVALYETFGGCNTVRQLADVDALRKLCGGPEGAVKKAKKLLEDGQRLDMRMAKSLLGATKTKDTSSRPQSTVIEVELGFIIFKARENDTTPAMMISQYLKTLKTKRAENDRRAA